MNEYHPYIGYVLTVITLYTVIRIDRRKANEKSQEKHEQNIINLTEIKANIESLRETLKREIHDMREEIDEIWQIITARIK